jgi:hypothetical protein
MGAARVQHPSFRTTFSAPEPMPVHASETTVAGRSPASQPPVQHVRQNENQYATRGYDSAARTVRNVTPPARTVTAPLVVFSPVVSHGRPQPSEPRQSYNQAAPRNARPTSSSPSSQPQNSNGRNQNWMAQNH